MTPPTLPTLLAVAHGTRDPRGAVTTAALLDRVRALRPGLPVRAAYVELTPPSVATALAAVTGPVVVVPLLLAPGYHSRVDIPAQVGDRPDTALGRVLGPHLALAGVLRDRLAEAGARPGDAVVVAAAGSTDPAGVEATEAQVRMLATLVRGPVVAAYVAAAEPDVSTAVARLRRDGARRVAVASYLLAPGHFAGSLAETSADLVTAPLGNVEPVARLVLDRYTEAATQLRPHRLAAGR